MARFLIVGGEERSRALADALQRDGNAVSVVEQAGRLGPLVAALEHVAIVCWLAEPSPEAFLLRAVDSSMRGLVHEARDWTPAVSETAARNSIPVAVVRADPRDVPAWTHEALAAIETLLAGDGSGLAR